MKQLFAVLLVLVGLTTSAQEVVKVVTLSEFIVRSEPDMDKEDFIMRVVQDSSFYQAYINMRFYPHRYNSELVVFNKGEEQKGKLYREATLHRYDRMAWVTIEKETTNGKLYKRNGEHKYLTAEMFDDVFFPRGRFYPNTEITNMQQEETGDSKIEEYKAQLKKMLFNPGQEISTVPFIGDKVAIFSDEMIQYYNFHIYHTEYDGRDCYVFDIAEKESNDDNDTVIKSMISYFDQETMNIVMREYVLKNDVFFFDFDIKIKVMNQIIGGIPVPKKMVYDGAWNVLFKKPEIIRFEIDFMDYGIRALPEEEQ